MIILDDWQSIVHNWDQEEQDDDQDNLEHDDV